MSAFGAWAVDTGSIDIVGTAMVAGAGTQWLDLDGVGPGTISQALATTPGTAYELTFCLSGNPGFAGGTGVKTVQVLWGSADLGTFTFDTTGMQLASPTWVTRTVSIPASATTGAATTLKFVDLDSDLQATYGPALDEISVVAR